jgi:hypothetical protein
MLVSRLLAATMIAGPAESAEPTTRGDEEPAGVAATPRRGRPARGTRGLLRSRGIAGLAIRRGNPTHRRHISK